MGPFCDDHNRIVVVFPISVRDPDVALTRACGRAYGKSFEVLSPLDNPEAYESAYRVIQSNMSTGSKVTVLDRLTGKVTLFEPDKPTKAWSAWIRVVDVSKFLLN